MKMYLMKDPGEAVKTIESDGGEKRSHICFLQMPDGSHSFDLGNGIWMAYLSNAYGSNENVYLKRKDRIQSIPSRCVFFRPKPDAEIENGFERIVPLENDDLLFLNMLLNPLYQKQLKKNYMAQTAEDHRLLKYGVEGAQNE